MVVILTATNDDAAIFGKCNLTKYFNNLYCEKNHQILFKIAVMFAMINKHQPNKRSKTKTA